MLAAGICSAQQMIFADSFPLKHPISQDGNVWWMNRVSELTDGAITFRYFPAEQLAHADNILDKVKDGVAQVGYVGVGYVSDALPLNGVTMLPNIVQDTVTASYAYWDLLSSDTVFRQEFVDAGVVPVFAVLLPPYQLVLGRPPATTMSDLGGLKLRVSGSMSLIVDAIDASPVSMSAPDMYMAMQRGTLDGGLFPVTSVGPYRIEEVTQSISNNAKFGSFAITVVMNGEVYSRLSNAQKEAIQQAGDETVVHLARILQQDADTELVAFRDSGIDVYSLNDELLRELAARAEQVHATWVKRIRARQMDGKHAIEIIKQALACSTRGAQQQEHPSLHEAACRPGVATR